MTARAVTSPSLHRGHRGSRLPTGRTLDAKELTEAVERVRSVAERIRKQLEGMKKKSATRLKRMVGKVTGTG